LCVFKSRNGFKEILVPRYYVPLNLWGRFCLTTKLHQGLVGILPSPVIRVGLSVRSLLYKLKLSLGRCSSTTEQPNRNRQTERLIPPAGSITSSGSN
jgi:hypothetical protein